MSQLLRRLRRQPQREHSSDTVDPAVEALQRGAAAVTTGTTLQGRVHGTASLLVTGLLGAALLAWYYRSASERLNAARAAATHPLAARADADAPLPPLVAASVAGPHESSTLAGVYRIGDILGEPTVPEAVVAAAGMNPTPSLLGTGQSPGAGVKSPLQQLHERLLDGAVYSRPAGFAVQMPSVDGAARSADEEAQAQAPSPAAGQLGALLSTQPPAIARAGLLPTQRLLLPKGSFIDCTLQTAIDSTLPGLVTCITAVDTFGADGTVLLLERGTKLLGETRGEVAQGAARVFVLWSEARTPAGVVVPLASPGTDELGRSGLPGQVDRHFRDRFGAAILLSMIDGTVQASAVHQSGGSGTVILNPDGTRDISTEVLRSTVNIPPTVRKQQGDRIQVLVARDLDFRSVYALRTRTPR